MYLLQVFGTIVVTMLLELGGFELVSDTLKPDYLFNDYNYERFADIRMNIFIFNLKLGKESFLIGIFFLQGRRII